jgi:RecB family exonuclease
MQARFLESPYASLRPRFVERPFSFEVAGAVVRGRVDAVYETDGQVEIVDFKTGRRPAAGDPSAGWQLDIYALAAVDCWGYPPDRLRTTEWYVESVLGITRDVDGRRVEEVRARLTADLESFAGGHFPPAPGDWCQRCDFRSICPEGRRTRP